MAESATVIPIKPPTAPNAKRRFEFPNKAIDKALRDYDARVYETRAVLRLLEQHVTAPPDGEMDEATVSGAVDAALRLLAPIEGLHDPFELKQKGQALAKKANG
jgi:hypothetical protein